MQIWFVFHRFRFLFFCLTFLILVLIIIIRIKIRNTAFKLKEIIFFLFFFFFIFLRQKSCEKNNWNVCRYRNRKTISNVPSSKDEENRYILLYLLPYILINEWYIFYSLIKSIIKKCSRSMFTWLYQKNYTYFAMKQNRIDA